MDITIKKGTGIMLNRIVKRGFNSLDGETPGDIDGAIRALLRLAYYNDNVFLTPHEIEKLEEERENWELANLYDEVE